MPTQAAHRLRGASLSVAGKQQTCSFLPSFTGNTLSTPYLTWLTAKIIGNALKPHARRYSWYVCACETIRNAIVVYTNS